MLLPHRLELHSSRSLASLLAVMHLAALVSLYPLPFAPWFQSALAVPLAMSAYISIRRHALLFAAESIRELILKADGTAELLRNDGRRYDARVSSQSTVLPWLILMLLETSGSRGLNPLWILPDSLTVDDRRVLRTWLRWKLT